MDLTTEEIKVMLSDERDLVSVKILVVYRLKNKASFYRLRLTYRHNKYKEHLYIPVVHYETANFLFVPWDWQEKLPDHPDDIAKIKWRATGKGGGALIFDGLPSLSF